MIGAVVVTLVGAGAVFTYNEITRIDRSNPKFVLSEYLRAVLVRKDQVDAELYSCKDDQGLAPIRALRDELDRRERDFGVSVAVSWGAHEGSEGTLTTDIKIVANRGAVAESVSTERWRFTLVDEDGWRVCGAEKIGDTPT